MKIKANIFWLTGMSGVGKSTLANYAKDELERLGFSALILDGDVIRAKYDIKKGYDAEDVKKNNLHVTELCRRERNNYNAIIVPIISPIDLVRSEVRRLLTPGYYLLYVHTNIETLKKRDPKGLYKKADEGRITDLIGYSDRNPYDIPKDYDLLIDTSDEFSEDNAKHQFSKYIVKKVVDSNTLF